MTTVTQGNPVLRLLERKKLFDSYQLGLDSKFVVYSSEMQEVAKVARKVASTDMVVLITGETGVGKQLVGRAIHQLSDRTHKPYVVVDSPNIKIETAETQLFGHKRGAFTSALTDGVGFFQHVQDGTIFIDEVSELPHELQGKFLRVLEERKAIRLGDVKEYDVKARIIVATNRNLKKMVSDGKFREDLYYRLNVIPINAPSLRERPEDIRFLAEYFLINLNLKYNANVELTPKAIEALRSHRWPGNVRELHNTMERTFLLRLNPMIITEKDVVLDEKDEITRPEEQKLPEITVPKPAPQQEPEDQPLFLNLKQIAREARIKAERDAILATLEKYKWNRMKAAKVLGVSYKTLLNKIKEYGPERT